MPPDIPNSSDNEPDDEVRRLAGQFVEGMFPGSGQADNGGGGGDERPFIDYGTDATVEPLTIDHLRMDNGVKACYEASRVPEKVIIDMARAAREDVESSTGVPLDSDAYDWPFGKSGGMLNPFDATPRNWIPGCSPPISVGAMMEDELRRAEKLKQADSPRIYSRRGWLGNENEGRFGVGNLFDSVYEGAVLIKDDKVIAWFTWWRTQFEDVMDGRRDREHDWSVADVSALFDERYKFGDESRCVQLNAGIKAATYLQASPKILRTDTANALPGYPGAAGYLFDKCVLDLMERYGYDMVHAWRIANMEVYKGPDGIGDRVYDFGSNDLSGDFLKRRKVEPKGTRLSDGLAIYNVPADEDSGPVEVRVLSREEHLIGAKVCMVPKMEESLDRYKPASD